MMRISDWRCNMYGCLRMGACARAHVHGRMCKGECAWVCTWVCVMVGPGVGTGGLVTCGAGVAGPNGPNGWAGLPVAMCAIKRGANTGAGRHF